MKSILILGAGLMQKPAIVSSKKLGLKVYVVDTDSNAICVSDADVFMKIDLKDKESILEYAKKIMLQDSLISVFTAGTDFSASVSYVCEHLGLKSHSFESALNASIKTRMRECFQTENVSSPKFLSVTEKDINNNLLSKVLSVMNYPFVVKPVDNMGARGCRMIRSEDEFIDSIEKAMKSSRSGNIIIEEYMEGAEYSIDSLIYNGTMTITGFAERHIYYPPYFIEMGHTMPAVLDKKTHDELISVFAQGVKSLGLSSGAAKADIKYTKKGPMIGEIAGRLSGGYMSGWTYPYASDLNLTEQAVKISCGMIPCELIEKRIPVDYECCGNSKNSKPPFDLFEVICNKTSAERAWISIPGTVKYIENIEDFTDKAVQNILPRCLVKIDSEVDFPRNNVEKCGNIISLSKSRDVAVKTAQSAVSDIFISLYPNNKKTDDFLQSKNNYFEKDFPPSAFNGISSEKVEVLSGNIAENKSIFGEIPDFLQTKDISSLIDWNYNTIKETARKFDVLRKIHPSMNRKEFWKALIKGGIQGAVYYSDSQIGK